MVGSHNFIYGGIYLDEYGRQNSRTPVTHPESYDGFVLNDFRENMPKDVQRYTSYSDRLRQEDPDKLRTLQEELGIQGDYWDGVSPDKIEKILSSFAGKPVKLTLIMQYVFANGYPYWRFDYYYLPQEDPRDNPLTDDDTWIHDVEMGLDNGHRNIHF